MRFGLAKKSKKRGQVALEYALTTVVMAIAASLLYMIYQPIVGNVFEPIHLPKASGGFFKDNGIGLRETLFKPLP